MSLPTKLQFCPHCFRVVDTTTQVVKKGEKPAAEATGKPGDFLVCLDCAAILSFDADLVLFIVSLDDVPESERETVSKVREAVQTLGTRGLKGMIYERKM